jgi:hypothetical protein
MHGSWTGDMTYTSEQLLARASFIDKQIATWKGNAEYANTLRMEAWALRTAAQTITNSAHVILATHAAEPAATSLLACEVVHCKTFPGAT